ncbi:hypothetical protein NQ314_013572 [Rhamnusium bicolor]|uniref:Uncharacterized protein n=1 Tax=Rhamnusium bicolor TaxID=1586634 RepID=A0AAV8X676_9CUCU|nr:hypothetical protein NQ314_013572 [Rhamnusium bicolor]
MLKREFYTLSSKCLYTCVNPHAIIILEDLTTLGFEMLPRHIGFDLDHCFKVVEKMALMHAASVIMYEKVHINFYLQRKLKLDQG